MRKKIKLILLVTAVILSGNYLFGQNTEKVTGGICPNEKLEVHLSQESVFPGELLWFKIYCTSPVFPVEKLSSLAFIELVSSENTSIIRKKMLLNNGEGLGEFEIPNNLRTGLYYILAYTNWMKNFGEASFFRKELIVVNPNQPINNNNSNLDSLKTFAVEKPSSTLSNKLTIRPDKNKYSTRQQVTLKIESNEISGKVNSHDFSISVYRKEPQMIIDNDNSEKQSLIKNPEKIDYLPDYKGIRLSGKLLDQSDNVISGASVTESIPGPGTDLKRSITDSNGDFNFLLKPKEGEQEIVFTMPDPGSKINLEESYWNGFRNPPLNLLFRLNPEAISYLKEKYAHFQFQSRFRKQYSIPYIHEKISKDSAVFYTTPYQLLKFKDYYVLDSIREYFHELIPSVRFSHRKGELTISVRDSVNMSYFEEKPGVFLDGIYYDNYAEITNMAVKEIDRIAVLPNTYYYKDFTFGGIIDIHTIKSDFHSVKPLPNMTRIIYPLADACQWKFISPDYSVSGSNDRTPDFRYLLYWEPNVKAENTGGTKVQFYTGDVKGKFIVKVTGMTEKGEIVQAENEIVVGD